MLEQILRLAEGMPRLRLPPLFPMAKVSSDEAEVVYEAQVSGTALLVFWWLSDDENSMHDPVSAKGLVQGLVLMTLLNAAISKWLPGKKARKLSCEVRMPCYVRLAEVRNITVRMRLQSDGVVVVALEAVVRQTSRLHVRLMDAEVELYEKV